MISNEGFRNSVIDLTTLNVAIWKGKYLFPTEILSDTTIDEIPTMIGEISKKTVFLSITLSAFQTLKDPSASEIGSYISNKLERGWSEGSKKRYGGAAKRWITYFRMKI